MMSTPKPSEIITKHIDTLEEMIQSLHDDFDENPPLDDEDVVAIRAGIEALKMNRMAEQEHEGDGEYDPV